MATPLRLSLVLLPFLCVLGIWIAAQAGLGPQIIALAEQARLWFSTTFAWIYLGTATLAIVAVIIACLAHGDIRFGGPDAQRRVTDFEAVAIGLAACTSMGLFFWSAAEPLFHARNPPVAMGFMPNTRDAQIFARAAAYFHWAILAQVIFGVFMIGFGIAVQTIRYAPSLDGVVFRVRQFAPRGSATVMDGLAIFFATLLLVGGLASAVGPITRWGMGAMLPHDMALGIGVLCVMLLVLLCGARPPSTSYAALAQGSLVLLLLLLIATIILGPTGPILGGGARAIWWSVKYSPDLLFGGFREYRDAWPIVWTVTQLAGWMVFAPLVGFFLSHVARGYRLDDAVIWFILCPALIIILTIGVFGGMAIATDASLHGAVGRVLDREGPGATIYQLLARLKGGAFLSVAFTATIVLAFVSFAAAALHATMRIAAPGVEDAPSVVANRRAAIFLWIILFGVTAWLVAVYRLGPMVEAVGRLGGLTALLLTIFVTLAVLRFCTLPAKALSPLPPEGVDVTRYEKDKNWRVERGDEIAYEKAIREGQPRSKE